MLTITVKSWSIKHEAEGAMKICGTYVVKSGNVDVASGSFNDGYGCQTIAFSSDIVAAAATVDGLISNGIKDYFSSKGA